MKKLVSLVLALSMCMTLAACGSKSEPAPAPAPSAPAASAPAASEPAGDGAYVYTGNRLTIGGADSTGTMYAAADRLQILRGERLYEEIPERRYEINQALMTFEQVLSKQNRTEIEQARKRLTSLLDNIEFDLT